MKHILALLLGTVLFSGIAFAHGDEQHVMGTVTKVTNKAITVAVAAKDNTAQKKSVTVNVVPATKFEKMGTAVTVGDIKAGDRVSIHAVKKGRQLEAEVVKIGVSAEGMPRN